MIGGSLVAECEFDMTQERQNEGVSIRDRDFSECDELVASVDETIRKEERAIYAE